MTQTTTQNLFDEIVRRVDAGERVGVCLVTNTRGSTPQKAGAVMLVLESGQTVGTLGGGCVEAEVRTRAQKLILRGEDRLLAFKLDGDYGWDDGLVCGGNMDIAVQTVRNDAGRYRSAANALREGNPATIAFTTSNEVGESVEIQHVFEPPATLVIAGAGHVGAALANVATPLGFRVTVIDDRPDCASMARFPYAVRIVGNIEHELSSLSLDPQTFIVIVTRGHRHDADALRAVVNSTARYIGLIGSKRKILTILRRLREAGISEEKLARVHAPIGLNIGAVTPEEIAVSIVAELIANRREAAASCAPMRIDPATLSRLIAST